MAGRNNPHKTDNELLSRLVCPVSGGPLSMSIDGTELLSQSARLAFPIRDGIPILVIGEARETSIAEMKGLSTNRIRES